MHYSHYLCIVIDEKIVALENVPVSTAVFSTLYPRIRALNKKVGEIEKSGQVIRLKKGLYVANPKVSGVPLSVELIANHIYAPSYVSMQSALRFYGLIPEAVYTTVSMTLKHSRRFVNDVGRFEYVHISKEAFPIGLTRQRSGDAAFIIATPEKALCDLIAGSSDVTLRYISETRAYLEDYIRFDMDALPHLDRTVFEQYAEVGKKKSSICTILKFLAHE